MIIMKRLGRVIYNFNGNYGTNTTQYLISTESINNIVLEIVYNTLNGKIFSVFFKKGSVHSKVLFYSKYRIGLANFHEIGINQHKFLRGDKLELKPWITNQVEAQLLNCEDYLRMTIKRKRQKLSTIERRNYTRKKI